mgnify:CR=1 FL=1
MAQATVRLARTVWNGCKSWYLTEQGRNTTNWPGFTLSYRALTRRRSLDADYHVDRRDEFGDLLH